MTPQVLGFVGLGNMGRPMATRIAAAGFELVCFDAAGTGDRLPPGATEAKDIFDLAASADTAFVSVPDGKATLTVAGALAAADPRRVTTVIDLSTVGPAAAEEAASMLAAAGVAYVDGPVSGGVAGARAAPSRSCSADPTRCSPSTGRSSRLSPATSSTWACAPAKAKR